MIFLLNNALPRGVSTSEVRTFPKQGQKRLVSSDESFDKEDLGLKAPPGELSSQLEDSGDLPAFGTNYIPLRCLEIFYIKLTNRHPLDVAGMFLFMKRKTKTHLVCLFGVRSAFSKAPDVMAGSQCFGCQTSASTPGIGCRSVEMRSVEFLETGKFHFRTSGKINYTKLLKPAMAPSVMFGCLYFLAFFWGDRK